MKVLYDHTVTQSNTGSLTLVKISQCKRIDLSLKIFIFFPAYIMLAAHIVFFILRAASVNLLIAYRVSSL
jgi:hypothetical protein